jgi:hypothetical protein
MLTPVDIHYLFGLLTLISQPDSVDVTLGGMVYDRAAKKKRDVDVVLTYSDLSKGKSVMTGIEVKKHKRPLTVEQVEQLIKKLSDMKEIKAKKIVSASGYTEGAINKARYYGIELLILSDWNKNVNDFDHIKLTSDFIFINKTLSWVTTPRISFNPLTNSEEILELLKANPKINLHQNNSVIINVSEFTSSILINALNTLLNDKNFSIPNDSIDVKVKLTINNPPYIETSDKKITLNEAIVEGTVRWDEMQLKSEYKSIYKYGEDKPYVGCAITEMPNGNLLGITFSQFDRNINLVNLKISDRIKKKIFNQNLKRHC